MKGVCLTGECKPKCNDLKESCACETQPPPECSSNEECDDDNECTNDVCAHGKCLHLACSEHRTCEDDDNDPCTSGVCHNKQCVPKPDSDAEGCKSSSSSGSSSSSSSGSSSSSDSSSSTSSEESDKPCGKDKKKCDHNHDWHLPHTTTKPTTKSATTQNADDLVEGDDVVEPLLAVCGNGIVEEDEECDGSEQDTLFDQCNAMCQFETRWAAVVVSVALILLIVGYCVVWLFSISRANQRAINSRMSQTALKYKQWNI